MGTATGIGAPLLALTDGLVEVPVTAQELELLAAVREIQAIGFGEVRVVVDHGRLDRYIPAPVKKFGSMAAGT